MQEEIEKPGNRGYAKTSLCVEWCLNDALIYEEREEEVEEDVKPGDIDVGFESMVNKYGLEKVADTVARIAKKGWYVRSFHNQVDSTVYFIYY